jgi:hypothetical protein
MTVSLFSFGSSLERVSWDGGEAVHTGNNQDTLLARFSRSGKMLKRTPLAVTTRLRPSFLAS